MSTNLLILEECPPRPFVLKKYYGHFYTYRDFLQVVSPEVEGFERREVANLHGQMCDFVARGIQLHESAHFADFLG